MTLAGLRHLPSSCRSRLILSNHHLRSFDVVRSASPSFVHHNHNQLRSFRTCAPIFNDKLLSSSNNNNKDEQNKSSIVSTATSFLSKLRSKTSSSSSSINKTNANENENESNADSTSSDTIKSPLSVSSATPKFGLNEIKRFIELGRSESKTITTALGLLAVSSTVSLSMPAMFGKLLDVFTKPTLELPVPLSVAAVGLGTLFLIGALCNTGRSILMRLSGQRIVAKLRNLAYGQVIKQDMSFYDLQGRANTATDVLTTATTTERTRSGQQVTTEKKNPNSNSNTPALPTGTGDIISRLNTDASIVGESITRELAEGLRALFITVGGVAGMLFISSKLTVVMLSIVPPSAIGAVIYGRYLKKLTTRTQEAVGAMTHVAEERISAIRTVHAFNAIPEEQQRFSKSVSRVLGLARKEAFASGGFYGSMGFVGNLTMIGLLTYGSSLVAAGEITVGNLSSLMLYSGIVGSSLIGLTSFFTSIMRGLGASSRIFELIDTKPISVTLNHGKKLAKSTPPSRIVLDDVTFRYPSRPDVEILKNLTLVIEPGTSIAFAGGSGSGKSTIANLLERFYDPSSGRILYGDEDIRNYSPESWRSRIAIVPQDPALFSGTIKENILYGNVDASMEDVEEAARLANCDFIHKLPNGFDTNVGSRASQLSGGQRQRIAIARALVRKPAILLLDEATSALDAASESKVNKAIRRLTTDSYLTSQMTTILIAHRLSTLKTADEIVLLQSGRVAERGSFNQLSQPGSAFAGLVSSQMLEAGSVEELDKNDEDED